MMIVMVLMLMPVIMMIVFMFMIVMLMIMVIVAVFMAGMLMIMPVAVVSGFLFRAVHRHLHMGSCNPALHRRFRVHMHAGQA